MTSAYLLALVVFSMVCSVILHVNCFCMFYWVFCAWAQFISPVEQPRQSVSAIASTHKWFSVLIASRLPHKPPKQESNNNRKCRHCEATP